MNRLFIASALLVLVSGCAGGLSAVRGERLDWRCASGSAFSIRIHQAERKAEAFAAGRIYRLDYVETGYSNGEVRYFEQAGLASLTGAHGGPYDNCRRN